MSEPSVVVGSTPTPWWRRYLQEDPGVVLTVLYLFLTLVGAIYNWRLCARFGVNILDLADVTDFLMFAVRDAFVVFLAFFPVVLFLVVYAFFARVATTPLDRRRGLVRLLGRKIKTRRDLLGIAAICLIAPLVYIPMFMNNYSATVAREIKAGRGRACEYVLAGDGSASPRHAQLITTTSRFVVVYRLDDRTTEVITVENLSRLAFKR